MKKFLILAVVVVVLVPFTQNLRADIIYANIGFITDDKLKFDPFLWYVGMTLNFNIADFLYLAPELNFISYKFTFKTFYMDPALMLNVKAGNFLVGAGINRMFLVSGGDVWESDKWLLKLNAGFAGHNVRLLAFAKMAFDSMFKNMLVGVQLGLGL